jgi:hypothetical protein
MNKGEVGGTTLAALWTIGCNDLDWARRDYGFTILVK